MTLCSFSSMIEFIVASCVIFYCRLYDINIRLQIDFSRKNNDFFRVTAWFIVRSRRQHIVYRMAVHYAADKTRRLGNEIDNGNMSPNGTRKSENQTPNTKRRVSGVRRLRVLFATCTESCKLNIFFPTIHPQRRIHNRHTLPRTVEYAIVFFNIYKYTLINIISIRFTFTRFFFCHSRL